MNKAILALSFGLLFFAVSGLGKKLERLMNLVIYFVMISSLQKVFEWNLR